MTPAIVTLLAVITVLGAAAIIVLSARLRDVMAQMFRAFDRAERNLVPVIATVRTDRDRLAERLERLTEAGIDPTRR